MDDSPAIRQGRQVLNWKSREIGSTLDWLVVWNHGILWLSHDIGNFIIPTDFHSIIFQGGRVKTTNQMETTDLIPRKWDLIPQS